MWSTALLLALSATLCSCNVEPELKRGDFSVNRVARSIFDSFGEMVFDLDVEGPDDDEYAYDYATEQSRRQFRESHSREIFDQLQERIMEAKLSDFIPIGLQDAMDLRPTGRRVGGIFSTLRDTVNTILDEGLSWIILQGYAIMPGRMEEVMHYLESDLVNEVQPGHHLHRRTLDLGVYDKIFDNSDLKDNNDDDDFIRMMATYEPNEQAPNHYFVSPTASDPAKCPNEVLWYSQCAKVMTLSYFDRVKKRAGLALKKLSKYMSF